MSQAGAAFGPSISDYLTAGSSRHPFEKAVLAGALAFFWLISLFRHTAKL
jgi:hypothetical protein